MRVNEIITNQIIENLETSGTWIKTWRDLTNYNIDRPNKAYTGINRLLIAQSKSKNNFNSNIWLTFKQIAKRNATIKTDQKKNSTIITFCKTIEDDLDEKNSYFMLRYYRIYNIDQLDNIEKPEAETNNNKKIDTIETTLKNYLDREQIKLFKHDNRAYYVPSEDCINMPDIKQFFNSIEYYQTLAHEITHSTGHKKRLDRDLMTANFASHNYSKEELVAELGALFTLAHHKLDTNIKNSSAYIKNWLKVLKNDPQFIISASSKAEKAFNYIIK